MSDEDRHALNLERTSLGVVTAIKATLKGKSPGPDGFPVDFYHAFVPILVHNLPATFTDFQSEDMLSGSFTEVEIEVFPKPGKDSFLTSNYRLI